MFEYRLQYGSYYLYDTSAHREGDLMPLPILHMCDKIAIAYDKGTYTLHKHGDPSIVNKWAEDTRASFRSHGYNDMANDVTVLEIDKQVPVDEINRCLSTSGYLKFFIAQFG